MIKVLCHGCWDVIHPGHLYHLRQAKALGDFLIVSILADPWVTLNKGPDRPVFKQEMRKLMLESFEMVDQVIITEAPGVPGVIEMIERIRPNVYCKGKEYEGWLPEYDAVIRCGGKVVFLEETEHSSTDVIHHSERFKAVV